MGVSFLAHWKDWKIYILMLSLTACVTGLSFNMSVEYGEYRLCADKGSYFPTLVSSGLVLVTTEED